MGADGELGPSGVISGRTRFVDAGGDILLRRRLTQRLYGWVSYTVMRSMRTLRGEWISGDFDQPHNLLAVASYSLPRNWRIGGRFRVASGNPYTPLVGSVDIDLPYVQGGQRLLSGRYNSGRFPLFHQLDLRIDKQWLYPRATVTGYLDIQNVYNRQNVEAWVYQYDYRSRVGSVGLPIFPSLGVKVDF